MSDSSNELKKKILTGKQALSNNYIDLAIQAFQEALNARIPESTSQNSLIGIAQAYLLLALGIKGEQEDDSTAMQMTEALALLPDEVKQLEGYIFLLMDIGKGLQKISFFISSILVYKKSLFYAQKQGTEKDLKLISTISWKLAFSYQNIGNVEYAAKLYRIAADLEEDQKAAITLYHSSAYQHYKAGMKEEAMNILQTAFDKAGILKETALQNEIAEFQGIISFEIYESQKQNESSSLNFEYLELAFDKFTFVNNSEWLTRIESERALLSTQTEKGQVISATSEWVEPETTRSEWIEPETTKSEKSPSIEIPTSKTMAFENNLKETIKTSLDISSPNSRSAMEFLDESTRMLDEFSKLTSESIGSTEEITELHQADLALSDGKPLEEGFQSVSSYNRLFSSDELISTEEPSSSTIHSNESKIDKIEPTTPIIGVRGELSSRLQNAGWMVQTNNISNAAKGSDPDIIAEKGLVRKKRKMIFFAEDVTDAEICSFLLQNNIETGEKYVYLLSGDPKKAKISKKIKIITRVDQIF
jgi:tetratricopeptide (TPR) repeat protein